MTRHENGHEDPHGEPEETALTPEEREVAALLAEAGGPVAVPSEVAARLDAVLADLVDERGDRPLEDEPLDDEPLEDGPDAVVLPLERAPRARRRWPRLVLAAAAVVVGGYAVGGTLAGGSLSGADDAGSAGDSAVAGGSEESAAEDSRAAGGGAADAEAPEGSAPSVRDRGRLERQRLGYGVVRIRSDRLAAGVERVLAGGVNLSKSLAELDDTATASACLPTSLARGERWAEVRYDGRRAVLVAGPEEDGRVAAQIFTCGGGDLLVTTTVDAP